MSAALVVGVDAGATTTRCVVAALDGEVVGRGVAGGANRNSSGGEVSAALRAALAAALDTIDRTDEVGLGVVGAAGSAGAGRSAFRAAAERAWRAAGISGELVTVTDIEVAYAAGTAEPDGVLLLSGTGALAARFGDGVLRRRCDGYGWLLGDEGSAVWIGVRALRAVLAALDGRGEPTTLVAEFSRHFEVGADTSESRAQALIAATFAVPPAALGRLAPFVSTAAEAGDPVAGRICAAAADRLLHTFDSVEPPPAATVVLAGSVLLSSGPVSRVVRAGLLARTGTEPRPARDGAAGAAALAVGRFTGAPVPPVVHTRLTGSPHFPGRG
ncbi:N-acetylglucosamine kinase [Actinoplanes regularis]|uniref:N-acetylglucosamine kinase n=1 Tax=Actinoplanes regularis TaxID=52697 RepID=UPI00255651A0|nr:BadF/BadG/BcrA/BcrD ATPase family protein [Actinoplanes regularis]